METIQTFQQYTITQEQQGQRLDVALASFMPDRSLREVRRLWEQYLIELNGRHSRKGMSVKEGDVVTVSALPEEAGASPAAPLPAASSLSGHSSSTQAGGEESAYPFCAEYPEPDLSLVRILKRENGVLAIFKPAGLHSAALPGGRGGLSLEGFLPELCLREQIEPEKVRLFNRLDCLTTGMVIACENDQAMHACEQAELSGEMEKRYFALVEGQLHSELTVKNMLDTDSRVKTRVLDKDCTDMLRHTLLTPLYSVNNAVELGKEFSAYSAGVTLVQAVIRRGARHQIRAHLAHAGHPILGDPIYNPACTGSNQLYLHNFAVALPGFTCLAPPLWPEETINVLEGLFPGLFQMTLDK